VQIFCPLDFVIFSIKIFMNKQHQDLVLASLSNSAVIPYTKASLPVINEISDYWCLGLNWVIRLEWDSNFKVCSDKKLAEALKPRGLFLQSLFLLCERCASYGYGNDNASVWFQKCLLELVELEAESLFNPPKVYHKNIKESLLDLDRKKLQYLKKFENPYGKPTLKSLINCAVALAEESDIFRKNHYKNFLTAYKNHIEELNSSRWGIGYIDGQLKHWVQGGRGRYGTTKILRM
jgi:hypothetical protein